MSDSNIWIMSASLCSYRYFPHCFSVCCIMFGGKPDTMCKTWVKSIYMWKYAYLFLCQTLSVEFAAVQEGIHLDFGFLIAMITSRQLPRSFPVVIPYVEDGEFFLSVLAPYSAFDFPCDTEPPGVSLSTLLHFFQQYRWCLLLGVCQPVLGSRK